MAISEAEEPIGRGPRRCRLLLLLVATTLSMYKPRGMIPYGQRKQREERTVSQP